VKGRGADRDDQCGGVKKNRKWAPPNAQKVK